MEQSVKKQRIKKWKIAYSSATQDFAEDRLRLRFTDLGNKAVNIKKLIDVSTICNKTCSVKTKLYDRIVELIETEDYPQGSIKPFKEASIADIVGTVLVCTISSFRRQECRPNIKLRREWETIAVDEETRGVEEFVVIDEISVTEDRIIFVVEAKRDNMDKGLAQCLLAMKDAHDNNIKTHNLLVHNKPPKEVLRVPVHNVYGFTTEGIHWRLIIYDGNTFRMSDEIKTMAPDMGTDKAGWMQDYSIIVDVLYYVLYNSL